jgi:PEGA domain
MKNLISSILTILIVISPLVGLGQNKPETKSDSKTAGQTQSTSTEAASIAPKPALAFGLAADTPVKLRLNRNMSSGTAKVDEKVDFDVVEEVKIGDVVVIPQGSKAIATVTEAQPKRRLGRSGKLNMNIDYVQLASGEKVALRAVKGGSGGNHVGAMTGAMVATGILFFPAAPLFLFMKGKNINIPKGTEITAYVAADTPLDPAKFINNQAAGATGPSPQAQADASSDATALPSVVVKSTPDGADITIGGKYVGSTPSTLRLEPGEHTIIIGKSGFKPWQRTIVLTNGGNITVDAALEKAP